tara:strand:- start:10203 stop:10745 length:543 start_codon:yes stop_codon:yes gene_type:complete
VVNHKLKCIFVEVPKTGSTSIRAIIGQPPTPHLNIVQIENQVTKNQFNKYFKFAFVRNPWDRALSLYKYILKTPEHHYYEQCCQLANFSAYLKERTPVPQQYDSLSKHGKIQVDFIGRFENMQHDFNIVCDKIGIPKQQLPHTNKSSHKNYTEYYDDETREIVAKNYKEDIEHFGYKFGE